MVKTELRAARGRPQTPLDLRDWATIYRSILEKQGADMNTKRRVKQVFGGVVFLVGCVSLLRVLGTLIFGHIANLWASGGLALNLWNMGTLVLLASLGVYFVCTGLRWMNPQLIKPPRFG